MSSGGRYIVNMSMAEEAVKSESQEKAWRRRE
jgi:hypothetical protein